MIKLNIIWYTLTILYIHGNTQNNEKWIRLKELFEISNGPLGMINGEIRDWQITASSTRSESNCHEKNARLYQSFDRAWCARHKSDSEWLQIDLGITAKITGVLTQGRANKKEYVMSYMISYSTDAYRWQYLVDQYGNQKIFLGNKDSYSIRNNYFDEPIIARFIKFHPIRWYSHPSLRVEIIGSQECKQYLGLPPYGKIRASTTWPSRRRNFCQADDGHLMSNKGWCSKRRYQHDQWLEFDLGHPSIVTSLITKGRGDRDHEQWVTKYKVSFSNDTRLWIYYKDRFQIEAKEFAGNNDRDSERVQFLNEPFFARYVRLHPIEWHNHVSMRAAILGCPHKDTCFPGYFRVNNAAQCIENLAYQKDIWTNDRGLFRSLGKTNDESSSRCVTMDNHFIEKPIWMIDLGRRRNIAGIVLNIQHENKDNFDRFNIYVDRYSHAKPSNLCSFQSITASFHLHFQCQQPLNGRYVYIEAIGANNHWNKFLTAVLCEIFAYEQ